MAGPDELPLPELTDDLKHQINVARADALVKLHEELNTCWANCFPLDGEKRLRAPAPDKFFPPFVAYGVAIYEARAEALLALRPQALEYENWLNFGLKTLICEALAPSRPVENWGKVRLDVPLSEWQMHMGTTRRHFDHPEHSALFSRASALINALEDPIEGHWDRFTGLLHNAISRRTLPFLTKALKLLRAPKNQNPEALTGPETATVGREEDRLALPNTVEHAPVAERSQKLSRKGDASLLAGKSLVTFRTAQEYLGISERQRQSLVKQGALAVQGKGHNKKITTESLVAYLPPENPQ